MKEIDSFVARHPHGTDVKPPQIQQDKPLDIFVPSFYLQALEVEMFLDLAKARGCPDETIAEMRNEILYSQSEPVLVSIEEE